MNGLKVENERLRWMLSYSVDAHSIELVSFLHHGLSGTFAGTGCSVTNQDDPCSWFLDCDFTAQCLGCFKTFCLGPTIVTNPPRAPSTMGLGRTKEEDLAFTEGHEEC